MSQLVSKPFTALGRPAIRSILAEIRELRKVFAAAGITVDGKSGWLGVTVGTYVGTGQKKASRLRLLLFCLWALFLSHPLVSLSCSFRVPSRRFLSVQPLLLPPPHQA